jgi:hypothetical protein
VFVCLCVSVYAFPHRCMDSLETMWESSTVDRELHGLIYFYVCALAPCVRSTILGIINSKSGENIPLYVLHAFLACVRTLCMCVHCTLTHFRTDSLQIWCNILRVTESCMGYLIFTCALAYAHVCTHAHCVRSHIYGRIHAKW